MTEPTTLPAMHHVAFACRDLDETHRFYGEVLGLELIHTEIQKFPDGYFRHVFYDLGDGSAVAFFDLHGVGEPDPLRTAISKDLDLPFWVNHLALRVTIERQTKLSTELQAAGFDPAMAVDHGWCQSVYFHDPNGILVELCADTPGLPRDPERAEELRHIPPTATMR